MVDSLQTKYSKPLVANEGQTRGGYTQSQIEEEYQDKGYGCKDLNDRNDKQLERYKEKASKVKEGNNGNKNFKFNFGYEGY